MGIFHFLHEFSKITNQEAEFNAKKWQFTKQSDMMPEQPSKSLDCGIYTLTFIVA
jgi:hypothetical protein